MLCTKHVIVLDTESAKMFICSMFLDLQLPEFTKTDGILHDAVPMSRTDCIYTYGTILLMIQSATYRCDIRSNAEFLADTHKDSSSRKAS